MKTMKTILFAVLVVLVVAVSSERRPPQLPQAYKATVTADLPFFGKVTGDEYYDYFSQAIRQDFSIFGQEMRSYMLYNTKKQFNIYPQSGQCEVKPLQGDIYPAFIPPFAVYKGDEQIDGIKCEHWYLDWFGTELSFYPTNLTGSGGDKPQNYLKRLRINMFGMKTQLDYKNVVPERPPASTFDISGFPSCKPPPPPPKVWTVKGYLKNAVNNQVIKVDNSRVQLKNTVTGNTVQARISDGLYTAEKIEQGVYVVNASVPGYLIATKELTVESNIGEGTFADMFLSPRLDSNQWRAILTWGNVPRDLDAHTTSSTGCHVSYSKKSCSTSYGTVVLDYDVTAGFGPETTTFSSITDGSYLFFIYNYSGDSNFMSSGAKVRLYNANGLVQEWNVPTSGYSASYRYWKVFTLDGKTGQVTPINQVVSSV